VSSLGSRMKMIRHKLAVIVVGIMLGFSSIALAQMPADCPMPPTCGPCGETIINGPLPSIDNCAVQPYQNFVATYESCFRGISGFYIGTGFGYGRINFKLQVPGILFTDRNNFSRNYIVEDVTAGYLYSWQRAFIGGELGYYYNTNTGPIFYEDNSSIVFTPVTAPLTIGVIPTTTVFPGQVRIDLNSNNHGALDLLPGFFLGPQFALFGRIGVEYASFSWMRRVCIPEVFYQLIAGGLAIDINAPFINGAGDAQSRQTSSAIGLRLGVGMAYYATNHVGFSLNYVHVASSRVTFTPNINVINVTAPLAISGATGVIPGAVTFNTNTLTVGNTITPTRNEILVGIVFSF
jgi:opacity protein-like surface antigen